MTSFGRGFFRGHVYSCAYTPAKWEKVPSLCLKMFMRIDCELGHIRSSCALAAVCTAHAKKPLYFSSAAHGDDWGLLNLSDCLFFLSEVQAMGNEYLNMHFNEPALQLFFLNRWNMQPFQK